MTLTVALSILFAERRVCDKTTENERRGRSQCGGRVQCGPRRRSWAVCHCSYADVERSKHRRTHCHGPEGDPTGRQDGHRLLRTPNDSGREEIPPSAAHLPPTMLHTRSDARYPQCVTAHRASRND